jgi:hypothetical protein
MNVWLKGHFVCKNPRKYKGDLSKIVYRSSWERTFMTWCDNDEDILAWSSETVIVPYHDPVKNTMRSYHVDFRIVTKSPDGPKVSLVEIKPYKQTIRPRPNKNKSEKTILTEAATWLTNEAKWKAARAFAKACGWEFHIITEVELFGGIDRGYKPAKKAPSSPAKAKKSRSQG